MKIKTSELHGAALDYAVAKCEGKTSFQFGGYDINPQTTTLYAAGGASNRLAYSTDWSEGGPIIEREIINLSAADDWTAWPEFGASDAFVQGGPTPLIAAMRCYVASKLGDEVDIPDELI